MEDFQSILLLTWVTRVRMYFQLVVILSLITTLCFIAIH